MSDDEDETHDKKISGDVIELESNKDSEDEDDEDDEFVLTQDP